MMGKAKPALQARRKDALTPVVLAGSGGFQKGYSQYFLSSHHMPGTILSMLCVFLCVFSLLILMPA